MALANGETMINMLSGYDSGRSDWKTFLSGWANIAMKKEKASLLSGLRFDRGINEEVINKNCRRLGLKKFPASYIDFLKSSMPDIKYGDDIIINRTGSLFPVDRINYLSSIDFEYYSFLKENGINSTDQEYFSYGMELDNSASKLDFIDGLIVIGINFPNNYLYLNSSVETIDGEFECILDCPGFNVRTLSFAAMMRYLYVYECEEVDGYPPYSDDILSKGLSSLIKANL